MNSEDFTRCIGKPEDAPEVQQMLAAVGVKKKLRVPKGDIEARIDMEKKGLALIFEPEERKSSRLILTSVQFYSDAEEDFSTFPGTLPRGLEFTDSQTEVHAKLGKPDDDRMDMNFEAWNWGELELTVEYTLDHKRIGMIGVAVPEPA